MKVNIKPAKISTNFKTERIYPELEDLEVTPTTEEQNYNGSFGNVLIHKIKGENLVINPKNEQQTFDGVYTNITVNEIKGDSLNITPSLENQFFDGVYTEVNVAPIIAEKLEITPTAEKQTYEGLYDNVTVVGDEGLKSTNIKKGESIFGVKGSETVVDTSDATVSEEKVLEGEITYTNGKKIVGTMKNNGVLNYTSSTQEQVIPEGYTEGGTISPIVTQTLEITPTTERQEFTGLYEQVDVKPIEGETLNIIPTTSEQSFSGIYIDVNVEAINGEELYITPSSEEQVKEGVYSKVTVTGDSNLLPENIKEGVTIFDVIGEMKSTGGTGEENAIIDTSLLPTNSISSSTSYILNRMITKLPEIDTSQWTMTSYLFYNCKALTVVPELNTSNVTKMLYMFYSCNALTTIPELDVSNVVDIKYMLSFCNALTNVGGFINLGKAYTEQTSNYTNYTLDLDASTSYTYDSLMNVINNLYDLNLTYDVANGGTLYTQQLVLGSTNLAKLTSEEIAIATNKGWTVS